ncbi:MAG: AraC family transcriptional regulator [Oscillospiraceae bacterium]|nr:AraC family transcriptional regulator [Oscillospiraceae bacterium]
MYLNSGYLNNSRVPIKDKSKPLIVTSCGTYRLKAEEKLPTWRPRGRLDYQLLYVASGKAHFYIEGEDREVRAGHMVIFLPRQEQHYEYYGKDKTEVYWVHFTGGDVRNILRKFEIPLDENVFYCGSSASYSALFKEMIHELQSRLVGYPEMLEMYLRQLLLLVQRTRQEKEPNMSSYLRDEMEYARRYFIDHYNEPINIDDFAQSRNMSVSWFMRNFKQATKVSPMQYILNIRMKNAVSLLETTEYNVTEIAAIVGYDNPLYFSRVFKKMNGVPPSDYRKK